MPLDELISKHADNWRLERLAAIDRAILRLAIHEMRATDTPPKVVINEAVELAKKFSSPRSRDICERNSGRLPQIAAGKCQNTQLKQLAMSVSASRPQYVHDSESRLQRLSLRRR